jgi:hypothetical protein
MAETIEKKAPVVTESSSVTIYPSALQDAAAIKDSANAALANRDPKALINVAQQIGLDTPQGNAALKTAQEMQERSNNFSQIVAPINNAKTDGERNLAAAKALRNVSQEPLYGQALIAFMMGQKDTAFNLATGGALKTTTEYAKDNGNIIQVTVNALGQPQAYFDVEQKRTLTPEEYSKRGGSTSDIDKTFAIRSAEENRTRYNSAFQNERIGVNKWPQVYSGLAPKLEFLDKFYRTAKTDLAPDEYAKLVGAINQSVGQSSTKANSSTYFNQINDSKNKKESIKVDAGLAAKLRIPAQLIGTEFTVDGNYLVSKSNGSSYDYGLLKQQTDSANLSSEATQNSQSTLDSIVTSKKFQDSIAGKSPQEKARLIQEMKTAIQFGNEVGSELNKAVDQYGKPTFISLPTAASFTDTQAQAMVQLAQHKQNAEQIAAYRDHFDKNAKHYDDTKTLPVPGAIGAAYTSKPIFNEIRDRWSNEIGKIMEGEYVARSTKQQSATKPKPQGQSTAPVAPPTSNKPPSLSELRRQAGGK